MRIGDITNVLGFGRDGSIYTTDCWLCRSPRRCGWNGIVPDVQSHDLRTDHAEICQFRSCSAVSVPSVAGQFACPRGPGNQDSALRSAIATVRGETDRNDPPGILGPNAILDSSRFGGEAPTLSGLFQSTTCAFELGRTAGRS